MANIAQVMMKLHSACRSLGEGVSRLEYAGPLPYDQFRSIIQDVAQGALSEHEIITLARYTVLYSLA